MKYTIEAFENKEGAFAKVVNEQGDIVCIGEGSSELTAIKDVCLVFADFISVKELMNN